MYQITLGYDNVGRISTKTEVVSGTSHVFDYTYDVDGQLFEVRKDGILVEQYGYDNNANRTSTLTATATYDDQDRLIEQGGVSYTFDADGYLTNRGSDTFAYSARGELLSATVGGQTVTYQYDGMGRRIGKTDAAGTAQYLYGNPANPFQMTATRDVAGTLTTYFYDVTRNVYAFDRGGMRYYVATDQLGTPKVVTDNAGSVIKSVEYDAWGVKTSDTNPAFDLPVGFAGGIPEDATGMVRFGFRDYEPGTGRWLARDPILFRSGQSNLFVYVGNNPINLIDPLGLDPFVVTVNYSNSQYGSVTMVWNDSILPSVYTSGTIGSNGTNIQSGIYNYQYGQHPMNPAPGQDPYPALNLYTQSGSRTLPATRTNGGTTATGINVHRGKPTTGARSGSEGCHVIPRNNWNNFINQFGPDDSGTYVYIRLF